MNVTKTSLEGVLVIEPDFFEDDRGFFLESYQEMLYQELGIVDDFVQDNHSRSKKNVLRGLHYQVERPQAQLLTVIRGKIFDVTVDLRRLSPTFAQAYGIELSDNGPRQIYMAPGFAHGFCVLSEEADLHYKVSRFYDPEDEGGVHWRDPALAIKWPLKCPEVSSRDAAYPTVKEIPENQLPHLPPVEND